LDLTWIRLPGWFGVLEVAAEDVEVAAVVERAHAVRVNGRALWGKWKAAGDISGRERGVKRWQRQIANCKIEDEEEGFRLAKRACASFPRGTFVA